MPNEIKIEKAEDSFRETVVSLLKSEQLPVEDLPSGLDNFLIALHKNKLVGAIGLEQYGNFGLLRSLVVDREYRNEHIAEKLVHHLETRALTSGVYCMYLLTETASGYFEKKGYQQINRTDVPAELQHSSEFSHVCPESAVVMKKIL